MTNLKPAEDAADLNAGLARQAELWRKLDDLNLDKALAGRSGNPDAITAAEAAYTRAVRVWADQKELNTLDAARLLTGAGYNVPALRDLFRTT